MKIPAATVRRKHPRVPVDTDAVVHLVDHRASSLGKVPILKAVIRNISVTGVYLDLPLILWPDTKIRVQFRIQGKEYDRYASIIRHELSEEDAGGLNGHGARFMPKALALVRPHIATPARKKLEDGEGVPLPTRAANRGFGSSLHIR